MQNDMYCYTYITHIHLYNDFSKTEKKLYLFYFWKKDLLYISAISKFLFLYKSQRWLNNIIKTGLPPNSLDLDVFIPCVNDSMHPFSLCGRSVVKIKVVYFVAGEYLGFKKEKLKTKKRKKIIVYSNFQIFFHFWKCFPSFTLTKKKKKLKENVVKFSFWKI